MCHYPTLGTPSWLPSFPGRNAMLANSSSGSVTEDSVCCFQHFALCWSVFCPVQSHTTTRTCSATALCPLLSQLWRLTLPIYCQAQHILHTAMGHNSVTSETLPFWTYNYGLDTSLRLFSLFLHKVHSSQISFISTTKCFANYWISANNTPKLRRNTPPYIQGFKTAAKRNK